VWGIHDAPSVIGSHRHLVACDQIHLWLICVGFIHPCSDASFGYPGGPLLFKDLNFGIDLDSRLASEYFPEAPYDIIQSFLFQFFC
jgi:hypothetical protein